tara:strand:+ start:946 stop:1785 length:840 start_codon:yes stop_codon:yes gene_type:complete
MIKTIDLTEGKQNNVYKYLSSAITPRPIALVSTMDKNGNSNLAPFSFFNVFSINPPVLIFSPVTSIRNGKNKDTLENIKETKECVIGIVTAKTAQQVSLASCSFKKGVNEFNKAGFTEISSDLIRASRIKESPLNFECKVTKIEILGENGGAGNLVIAEILKIHINTNILDENGNIDPFKLDIVSRYGGNWYGKTTKESLYEIAKPISNVGMGMDNLPEEIKNSTILSGNELAILASAENIPLRKDFTQRNDKNLTEKHILAKEFLSQGKIDDAWQILL